MSSLVLGLLIIGVAGLIIMGTIGVREADSGPDEED
jgi:hypothetical protein